MKLPVSVPFAFRCARRALLAAGPACVLAAALADEPPTASAPAPAAESAPTPVTPMTVTATKPASLWDLPAFIERLPDMLSDRLPGLEPTGSVRIYVRPHFGDFLHRDYVRVPVGIRDKISETIECTAEVESYFTHGLGDAAGYGFSHAKFDIKREHVFTRIGNGGLSVGLTYLTPLSHPPVDLTDGYRHLQPYVAATRPLGAKLLGFAGGGIDLLSSTALPSHFGRNQLHSNSITIGAGVAREWEHFHGSLTATVATSALMSDESKQVYALRPEVSVPWSRHPNDKTQFIFTLGGRAIHGPDGNEFGASGSVRVEFRLVNGK